MAHHRVKLTAAALALALGLAALPGAAEAQFFGNWGGWDDGGTWDGMTPQQVRRAIAQRGFRVLAPLRRNGNVFVADVVDGRGRHERLIVAAADAQILQRFLVDDGRSAGAFARGGEPDRDGLVPPADIPSAGRHFVRPAEPDAAPQRFGDLGTDDDSAAAPPRRAAPAIRTVKPRPRTVDRSPDVEAPSRAPGAIESAPLAPVAPRPAPAVAAPATAKAPPPAAPPVAVASRPEPAAQAPAPRPAPPAAEARRTADPLAIPGDSEAGARPVRSVSGAVTGAPAASAPAAPVVAPGAPGRAADVPVAPLD